MKIIKDNLPKDGSQIPVQIGSSFQTSDGAVSPVGSPLTFTATQTITVPQNAAEMVLVSPTNAITVSENSSSTTYFTMPASTFCVINCARMSNIYLTEASSGTTVSFYFTII